MNSKLHTTSKFGECSSCSTPLEAVWFTEYEYKTADGIMYKTGRKRRAVDYLVCPECDKHTCVDDSFDGNWY